MHVYHYAAYEQTALKRLTGRHGTRETELDALLRGERFVDLYAVVRQGLRISKPSYSIKKLEDFYWGHTRTAADAGVADAMSSVVEYERFLVDGDASVLDVDRRLQPRRRPLDPRPARLARGAAGRARAGARRPAPARCQGRRRPARPSPTRRWPRPSSPTGSRTPGTRCWPASSGWHRREERPKWWDIYRLKDLDDEALQDDAGGARSAVRADRRRRHQAVQAVALRVPAAGHQGQRGPAQAAGRRHPGRGRRDPRDGRRRRVAGAEGRAAAGPRRRRAGWGRPSRRRSRCCRSRSRTSRAQVLAGGSPLGRALLDRRVPRALQARPGEQPVDQVVRAGARPRR